MRLVVAGVILAAACSSRMGVRDTLWGGEAFARAQGGAVPASPGPLFTLTETDEEGTPLPVSAAGIVDVNSQLVVTLQRGNLQAAVAGKYSTTIDQAQFAALQSMLDAAKAGLEQVKLLDAALQKWEDGAKDAAAQQQLRQDLQALTTATATIFAQHARMPVPGLLEAVNARIEAIVGQVTMPQQYQILLEEAANRSAAMHDELLASLTKQGVFVQFGAWLRTAAGTSPLHLRGFDSYPEPEEEFRVPRVSIALNEEQKQQLAGYAAAAKQFDADSSEFAKKMATKARAWMAKAATDLLAPLDDIVNRAQALANGAANDVRDTATRIATEVGAYREFLTTLARKYGQLAATDATAVLTNIADDLDRLLHRSEAFVATLRKEADAIIALAAARKAEADALVAAAGKVLGGLQASWQLLTTQARQLIAGRTIDRAALEFGDEVTRWSVLELPSNTELALAGVGRRAAGDKVLFRLAAGRGDNPRGREILAERELTIYQVLTHITSTPLLMFANPEGPSGVQQDFQAAPAYSVLLKAGSRDSHFYNRFFDPGIGLTFAALDFDGDDSLEVGVAGTLSMFRDWIQLGYGYDFGTSQEFWFVGGAIPLGSMIDTAR